MRRIRKNGVKRVIIGAVAIALSAGAGGMSPLMAQESYPAFSYDAGAGSGVSGDGAFFEFQAALNTQFMPWLTWRNSGFYRNESEADDFFGVDTSLLSGRTIQLGRQTSLRPQAGAGYRFTSQAHNAPFLEGGVTFDAGDFAINANVKYVFYDLVGGERGDEFIYSANASGRTRGRF